MWNVQSHAPSVVAKKTGLQDRLSGRWSHGVANVTMLISEQPDGSTVNCLLTSGAETLRGHTRMSCEGGARYWLTFVSGVDRVSGYSYTIRILTITQSRWSHFVDDAIQPCIEKIS